MERRALLAEALESAIVAATLVAFYVGAIRFIRRVFDASDASLTPGVATVLVVLAVAGGCALLFVAFTYWYAKRAGNERPGHALLTEYGRTLVVALLLWGVAVGAVAGIDVALIEYLDLVDPDDVTGVVLHLVGLVAGVGAGFATLSYYHYRREVETRQSTPGVR